MIRKKKFRDGQEKKEMLIIRNALKKEKILMTRSKWEKNKNKRKTIEYVRKRIQPSRQFMPCFP
jgi:DNA polymerase III delta subunit